MPRPSKPNISANDAYLKEWDEFQRTHQSQVPILLPVSISIEDGIIARDRIKSDELAKLRKSFLKEFKVHCKETEEHVGGAYCFETFETMLDEYIEAFSSDGDQGPRPPSPLDFKIGRPVWFLFHLPRDNWTFTKDRQYSMENDRDDHMRNCEKVCTLDGGNFLVLSNSSKSAPKGLKYNLHVTITQKEGRKKRSTDIIIDPGMDNEFGYPGPPPPPPSGG